MWKFLSRGLRETFERGGRLRRDHDVGAGSTGSRGQRVCCWWRSGTLTTASSVISQPGCRPQQQCYKQTSTAEDDAGNSSGPKDQRKRSLPYSLCDSWLGAVGYSGALIVGWVFSQPSSECRWKKWYNSFKSAVVLSGSLNENINSGHSPLHYCGDNRSLPQCRNINLRNDGCLTSKYPSLLQLLARVALSQPITKKFVLPSNTVPLNCTSDDGHETIEYGPITSHQALEEAGDELRRTHDSIVGDIENREGVECMSRNEHARAVQLFRRAAIQRKYPAAAYNLGQCYELGLGTKQDFKQAAAWYQRGTDLGHPTSMYNLGVFYAHGWGGLEANWKQARRLLEEAAQLGQPDAIQALGMQQNSSPAQTTENVAKQNCTYCQENVPDYHEEDLNVLEASTSYDSNFLNSNNECYDPVQLYNMALSYESSIQNNSVDPYLILQIYQMASDRGHLEARSKLRQLKAFDAVGLLSDYLLGLITPTVNMNEFDPAVNFINPTSSCIS